MGPGRVAGRSRPDLEMGRYICCSPSPLPLCLHAWLTPCLPSLPLSFHKTLKLRRNLRINILVQPLYPFIANCVSFKSLTSFFCFCFLQLLHLWMGGYVIVLINALVSFFSFTWLPCPVFECFFLYLKSLVIPLRRASPDSCHVSKAIERAGASLGMNEWVISPWIKIQFRVRK
jgi:hypothetical protein